MLQAHNISLEHCHKLLHWNNAKLFTTSQVILHAGTSHKLRREDAVGVVVFITLWLRFQRIWFENAARILVIFYTMCSSNR